MRDLSGRSAVVTGAGSGIGRAIARSLATAGVGAVVADIERDAADAVAADIVAAGGRAVATRTDVSDPASVDALAEFAFAEFGAVDILVNNAGVALRPFRATWDTDVADFDWLMRVNFGGVVNGMRAFVPRLREQPGGALILNTSSLSSFSAVAGLGAYSASKAAIDALSACAREEFRLAGIPIEVSVLFPGGVSTNLAASDRLRSPEERAAQAGVTPWSDYLPAPVAGVPTGTSAPAFLDADPVGAIVVEGIRRGEPFITTVPPSREALVARAEALARAFHG